MQVTWNGIDTAQAFSLTLIGADGTRQTVSLPAGTTEYTFTGLSQNTEYHALLDVTMNGVNSFAGSDVAVTSKFKYHL